MSNDLTHSESLQAATQLTNGARFYKCAFQVNPFAYVQSHPKGQTFSDANEYNSEIVKALVDNEVEVVAITDHYRADESWDSLKAECERNGIHVIPGFEAVAKDGVHVLCLFQNSTSSELLNKFIAACGVYERSKDGSSPTGDKDTLELLAYIKERQGVAIAAHVCADQGGLLKKLSGQPRVNTWTSPDLLACSLPATVEEAPESLRAILSNKDGQHKRERPVAIINAQDISAPSDVSRAGAWCWVKMSEISVEGLRQAFVDPESRIRFQTAPEMEEHAEIVALSWQGGFLDKTCIHFNKDLNVLIGGRGTGKSTIVESIRYVLGLEPLGENAKRMHDSIVKSVLKSGTKISLLVRSHRPQRHHYTIERAIPNNAIVKDEHGEILSLKPSDLVGQAEVYGQHEISELTKDKTKLTRVLGRFVPHDGARAEQKHALTQDLGKSRSRILECARELKTIEERLANLPGLEEKLKRFQEAGLEEKLKEKSLLVKEETLLRTLSERIKPLKEVYETLTVKIPVDCEFLSDEALKTLPGGEILKQGRSILTQLNKDVDDVGKALAAALRQAEAGVTAVKIEWDTRKIEVEQIYEQKLRELQESSIDGEEFIRLREAIEKLKPLKEESETKRQAQTTLIAERKKLLDAWENLKRAEYEEIARAAKSVSKKLKQRVRVEVTNAGDACPLIDLLKDKLGGTTINQANRDKLQGIQSLSVSTFADACRNGKPELTKQFGLTPSAAEKIIDLGEALFMEIEELELPATTRIELNVAPEGDDPEWKDLDSLSTGQKATAVLLLLLLDSEYPLIVDQPEDDLDNRFITDGVVPIMRQQKRTRQFIFSTHNANIPVLGDAELILGLSAQGEEHGRISPDQMGAIDAGEVRKLVGEILEGGQAAFELRRLKYGY